MGQDLPVPVLFPCLQIRCHDFKSRKQAVIVRSKESLPKISFVRCLRNYVSVLKINRNSAKFPVTKEQH